MTPKLEFSRPTAVRRIGVGGVSITVEATPEECARIAARLNLPEVSMLRCKYQLQAGLRNEVTARGALAARFKQECVVTLEPFEDVLAGSFTVRFVPQEHFIESAEPDLEAEDEIPYEGDSIDLGEAAVEQFALDLPLYPHAPNATLPSGIVMEEEEVEQRTQQEAKSARVNPFSALEQLRRKDN